jgi:hypothetical protein
MSPVMFSPTPSISKFDEKTRKFITSKTVNILNESELMNKNQHQWQHYELFRQQSPILIQSPPTLSIEQTDTLSINEDISKELRLLIEQCLPDLCHLNGEPIEFINGRKFYCTIKDILTSDGEFWVEREFSIENERKFRYFIDILSLFAVSYESLKQVYVGQLVALYYESSWHRALVVSKSQESIINTQASARVRLVDYGSSLYVNVTQLKWLPEQFYLFPFKVIFIKFDLK